MPGKDISHYLDANSDHAPRSVRISFINRSNTMIFSLVCWTYNMLSQCHSREHCRTPPGIEPYANNPFYLDENLSQYYTRKINQITNDIIPMLKGDSNAVFLQEADWAIHARNEETEKIREKIRHYLYKILKIYQWDIILPNSTDKTQALVLLYNPEILQRNDKSYGLFHDGHKFRGHATDFIHLPTYEIVTLVNLHLPSTQMNFHAQIRAFQMQQICFNKSTIMAGDTNGINKTPCGFFDGWGEKFPSYVNKNPSAYQINNSAMDNCTPYPAEKTFDGFFANPSYDLSVHTRGNYGYYFAFDTNSQRYCLKALPEDQFLEKRSFFGYPIIHFHEQLHWLEYAIAHYPPQQKTAVFNAFQNIYRRYFHNTSYSGFPMIKQFAVLYQFCQNVQIDWVPEVLDITLPNRAYMPLSIKPYPLRSFGFIFLQFHSDSDTQRFIDYLKKQNNIDKKPQGSTQMAVSVSLEELKCLGMDISAIITPLLRERSVAYQNRESFYLNAAM